MGPLAEGELLDQALCGSVIAEYEPIAAIHFAASAYVGESVQHPEKYYLNNVSGTLSLLSSLRATNVRKVVFSSSCATYGIPSVTPVREEEPQHPITHTAGRNSWWSTC